MKFYHKKNPKAFRSNCADIMQAIYKLVCQGKEARDLRCDTLVVADIFFNEIGRDVAYVCIVFTLLLYLTDDGTNDSSDTAHVNFFLLLMLLLLMMLLLLLPLFQYC